jgi:hypothetical protein
MFESITLAYDPHEDRVVLATDLGKPAAAAFWLTRRMALALLQQAPGLLDSTSPLTAAASFHDRSEVAAIEREAALGATQNALSPTQGDLLDGARATAKLAVNINVEVLGPSLRLTLSDVTGREIHGELQRAMFQRILSLILDEAIKAQWVLTPASDAEADLAPVPIQKH